MAILELADADSHNQRRQGKFVEAPRAVEAGEEIVIARGKTPVARLTPVRTTPTARRFGALKGIVTLDHALFEPLTESDLAEWE